MKFKESEILELKKSTGELKEAVISIAAILNKHGKGRLYFGVKNDGTVIGQDVGEATLRDVSRTISEHIDPKIYPKINLKHIKGKSCILVEFEGDGRPYFAYGRVYMRVADEDRQLSIKELEKLIAKKSEHQSKWESERSDLGIEKASVKALRQFVKKANDVKRLVERFGNARHVLNKLGLIKANRLLNAGVALFSPDNKIEVQAAVFAGKDKITFLDIQTFRGTLFELIEKSESYVKEHMNWRADLSGSRRVEIPEIPVRALREAIVNSLCHRDFSNPKGNEIAIFKDRIEIYNPGRFPEDHVPQEFIDGKERSILRNPLIANTFFLTSDIERWGSGLQRIHEACTEAGIKVAFENLKTGFLVTFRRPPVRESQMGPTRVKTRMETRVKTRMRKPDILLQLISKNPAITRQELARHSGLSIKGVDWNLLKLKKEGRLKRQGPDKGGTWKVIN